MAPCETATRGTHPPTPPTPLPESGLASKVARVQPAGAVENGGALSLPLPPDGGI
jgi:hypothetical protein